MNGKGSACLRCVWFSLTYDSADFAFRGILTKVLQKKPKLLAEIAISGLSGIFFVTAIAVSL